MNPLFAVVFLILVIKNFLRRNIVVVQFSLVQLAILLEHIINSLYVLVIHYDQNILLNKKLLNMLFAFKKSMEIIVSLFAILVRKIIK